MHNVRTVHWLSAWLPPVPVDDQLRSVCTTIRVLTIDQAADDIQQGNRLQTLSA